jgi:glycosyltransferase involved in cell wall biosynthesis
MYKDKKVAVVLPAYNAEKTLRQTIAEIPENLVDFIILGDDNSIDNTVGLAKEIGIQQILRHEINKGYGANQKTLYSKCIDLQADIIIMVHPDYQYTPKLIPAMVNIIGEGLYDVVLGSRILGKGALRGGMPLYKYIANRLLTLTQNILVNHKLSEYHTGYRAFSLDVLKGIKFMENSDDFVFDNQMLSQIIMKDYGIAEITCPTKYFEEASSINFKRSVKYGLGVLKTSFIHLLHRRKILKNKLY